ncbi:MAG TPA: hypothetical protein VFD18_05155 [Chthoniobacterales bacterium]|nr:hypothetical protein [Chthoniobacterales bacterium]
MKALDSYLNDHLAGSIAALELLDRLIEVSEGNPREQFFRELRSEIDADHKTRTVLSFALTKSMMSRSVL